ncbi:MAG: virulence-associated E family protein, partial [Pseudomonadota bacterium]
QRQVTRAMAAIAARGGSWPRTGNDGLPIPSHPENIRHALAHLGISAQRNTFTNVDEFAGYGLDGRDLNDIADILVSEFIRELQFGATPASIKREMLAIAHSQTYHPVIDYIDGLEWDGVPRIDTWLADFTGAEKTELNKEFGSKLLIAGVRRIRSPGVKFDTMLVLEGFQGTRKSRLAAELAVREEWFCGSLDLKSDDKTKAELLQLAWIVECQELDGLNKATGESLKRFLSTSVDSYRRAYARDAGEYKRHCIILGTTNEDTYLRDLTGNRRIWPVEVGRIDVEGFKAKVDQLWAEAAVREAKGESIFLSKHLWEAARELQRNRMVEDPYEDTLLAEFQNQTGRVSLESIKLLLKLDTSRMSGLDGRRIRAIMAGLGWEYKIYRLNSVGGSDVKPRRGFARGTPEERKVELVAERLDGGMYTIVRLTDDEGEMPF